MHFPSRHLAWGVHVLEVDDPQRAGGVVGEIDVVTVDERAMYTSTHRFGVLGEDLGMSGIRGIQEHDPVLAARGAFTREHADLAVRGHAHVVDQTSVHGDGIG